MSKYKKAWQLTREEAHIICHSQSTCDYCPLSAPNGCLRSVAGFTKEEINRKVEVKDYDRD